MSFGNGKIPIGLHVKPGQIIVQIKGPQLKLTRPLSTKVVHKFKDHCRVFALNGHLHGRRVGGRRIEIDRIYQGEGKDGH